MYSSGPATAPGRGAEGNGNDTLHGRPQHRGRRLRRRRRRRRTRPTSRPRRSTASTTSATGWTRRRARSSASSRRRTPRRPTRCTARRTAWSPTRSTPSPQARERSPDCPARGRHRRARTVYRAGGRADRTRRAPRRSVTRSTWWPSRPAGWRQGPRRRSSTGGAPRRRGCRAYGAPARRGAPGPRSGGRTPGCFEPAPRLCALPSPVPRWLPEREPEQPMQSERAHEPVDRRWSSSCSGGRASRSTATQRLPVPEPQELGSAGLPAARRAPADRRSRLASLLFAEADDPLRALRWSPRRDPPGPRDRLRSLDGDPVRLTPARPGRSLDVDVLVHGHWREARRAPGARRWTSSTAWPSPTPTPSSRGCSPSAVGSRRPRSRSSTRRRWGCWLAATSAAARDLAVRATEMSPLDENHQALLIRHLPARRATTTRPRHQFEAWSATAERELGVSPGPGVLPCVALRERPRGPRPPTRPRSTPSPKPAPRPSPPVPSMPVSRRSRPRCGWPTERASAAPRIETRLVLGEALIHTLGGLDEAGLAAADRGRADRRRPGRPRGGGPGPRRAGVRRLPAGPLRPGRAARSTRSWPAREASPSRSGPRR